MYFTERDLREAIERRYPGAPLVRIGHRPPWETKASHLARRMIGSIERIDDNGCWIWGRRRNREYGMTGINERTYYAHRSAWSLANNCAIPDGLCVCHRCDNPPCVNPAHLFLGTHTDNMRDCVAKGRKSKTYTPPPDLAAKLTRSQVDHIRQRLVAGDRQKAIAAAAGITASAISNIRTGKTWRFHETPGLSPPYRRAEGYITKYEMAAHSEAI